MRYQIFRNVLNQHEMDIGHVQVHKQEHVLFLVFAMRLCLVEVYKHSVMKCVCRVDELTCCASAKFEEIWDHRTSMRTVTQLSTFQFQHPCKCDETNVCRERCGRQAFFCSISRKFFFQFSWQKDNTNGTKKEKSVDVFPGNRVSHQKSVSLKLLFTFFIWFISWKGFLIGQNVMIWQLKQVENNLPIVMTTIRFLEKKRRKLLDE